MDINFDRPLWARLFGTHPAIVPPGLRKLPSKKIALKWYIWELSFYFIFIPQGHELACETQWEGELNKAGVTAQVFIIIWRPQYRSAPSQGFEYRQFVEGHHCINLVCNDAVFCPTACTVHPGRSRILLLFHILFFCSLMLKSIMCVCVCVCLRITTCVFPLWVSPPTLPNSPRKTLFWQPLPFLP